LTPKTDRRAWMRTHRFSESDGQTVIDDQVDYRRPLFPLGEIAYPLVRWQVGQIFAFRQHVVRQILLGHSPMTASKNHSA
jgi:ligand-binding SRPBCC domain-containing protein